MRDAIVPVAPALARRAGPCIRRDGRSTTGMAFALAPSAAATKNGSQACSTCQGLREKRPCAEEAPREGATCREASRTMISWLSGVGRHSTVHCGRSLAGAVSRAVMLEFGRQRHAGGYRAVGQRCAYAIHAATSSSTRGRLIASPSGRPAASPSACGDRQHSHINDDKHPCVPLQGRRRARSRVSRDGHRGQELVLEGSRRLAKDRGKVRHDEAEVSPLREGGKHRIGGTFKHSVCSPAPEPPSSNRCWQVTVGVPRYK